MINDKINTLNPMQKEAVLNTEGPLLLLAGAGSGKTRVLTHRIAYLIENGVRPFNILAITFTNKASKEMKERVEAICEKGSSVWVSTFHSTCVRILRNDIDKLGYTNQFTIYDADDSERLIKDIYKDLKINDELLPVKQCIYEISRQKDSLVSPVAYSQSNLDFKKKHIADVYLAYENKLKANNALDFDDLILKTVQLFQKDKETLEKYQDRFKYIMVDEYQDTSTCQYTLIKLLASKYNNLCVVGDDDQSIYGWRGANIHNILNFEKDFENCKVIKLEQNYRSSKVILKAANEVIKNNFGRKDKKLWTENTEGELITFNKCNSDREESKYIIQTIEKKIQDQSLNYKDIAILYRTNALSRVVEETLVKSSIPYKIYGNINFYSRKEIKDIMSYLKVLQNPSDEISLKRIINVPKRSIGIVTILKLSEFADNSNISLFEALQKTEIINDIGRKSKNLIEFSELMDKFIKMRDEVPVSELIKAVIEDTKYIEILEKEKTEESISRIENLEELINKAIEFEENNENANLLSFLEEISLVSDIDKMEDSDNVVTLMTLHSSKGLEFPTVFISGFEEGIFPSYRSIVSQDASALEEERRLLYVGITRAKNNLFITCAKQRLQNGKYMNNMVSSFFKELPKECLSLKDMEERERNIAIKSSTRNYDKYNSKPSYTPNVSAYLKKEIPAPKNVTITFKENDKISHFKFGIGKVLKIEPAGADYEVTVEFENFGTKKLMANLSKLKNA